MPPKFKHLIFSGGGPNGILQIGVAHEALNIGCIDYETLESVCGASAGAIMAVVFGLKLPLDECVEYIIKRPWNKFAEVQYDKINTIGGLLPCDKVGEGVLPLLLANGIPPGITFREAFERTGIDIIMIGTEISSFDMVIFDKTNFPDMPLIKALSLSSALPVMFAPGEYNGKWYIDGGMSVNFPFNLRYEAIGSAEEILAINMIGNVDEYKPPASMLDNLIYVVNQIILRLIRHSENHENALKLCPHYIPVKVTSMSDPNLWSECIFTEEGRQGLIDKGRAIAQEKFGVETEQTESKVEISSASS